MTTLNVALVGCGGFVRHTHLNNLLNNPRFHIHAAVDLDLEAAEYVAAQAGAAYATADIDRAVSDPAVDVVMIVTPHHTHADLAIQAAQAGRHIFCEKPMALDEAGCQRVIEAVRAAGVKYIGGYNRSVAPFTEKAREILAPLDAPVLIYHRWANWNPYSWGWLLDEKKSGSRVVGAGGHSLDMMCRLVGKNPVRVYAEGGVFAPNPPETGPDSALVTLGFADGSSGVLLLSSVANDGFPKEEIQITCANHTIVMYGFWRMEIFTPEGHEAIELSEEDKGLRNMLDVIADAILDDAPIPIGLNEAFRASRATFAAVRSIRTHEVQYL
jgi:predicted dehydrogenase